MKSFEYATPRTVDEAVEQLAEQWGETEVLALVPEAEFYANPKNPGDAVGLAWDEGRLHRLLA